MGLRSVVARPQPPRPALLRERRRRPRRQVARMAPRRSRCTSRASRATGSAEPGRVCRRSAAGRRRTEIRCRRRTDASARYATGDSRGRAAQLSGAPMCACTRLTDIDPSPTADATRFTDPARASPAANTPGRLVSSSPGSRADRIPHRAIEVRFRDGIAGQHEALRVELHAAAQPTRVRRRADEQEQRVGLDVERLVHSRSRAARRRDARRRAAPTPRTRGARSTFGMHCTRSTR